VKRRLVGGTAGSAKKPKKKRGGPDRSDNKKKKHKKKRAMEGKKTGASQGNEENVMYKGREPAAIYATKRNNDVKKEGYTINFQGWGRRGGSP